MNLSSWLVFYGLAHGAFFAIATNLAFGLITKYKQARALALKFTRITVALVAGVPFGTFLAASFSWLITFWITTLFGALSFLSVLFFVPAQITYVIPQHPIQQLSIIAQPKMLLAYFMTALNFDGPFITFT